MRPVLWQAPCGPGMGLLGGHIFWSPSVGPMGPMVAKPALFLGALPSQKWGVGQRDTGESPEGLTQTPLAWATTVPPTLTQLPLWDQAQGGAAHDRPLNQWQLRSRWGDRVLWGHLGSASGRSWSIPRAVALIILELLPRAWALLVSSAPRAHPPAVGSCSRGLDYSPLVLRDSG